MYNRIDTIPVPIVLVNHAGVRLAQAWSSRLAMLFGGGVDVETGYVGAAGARAGVFVGAAEKREISESSRVSTDLPLGSDVIVVDVAVL